jgi:hypothetical protein
MAFKKKGKGKLAKKAGKGFPFWLKKTSAKGHAKAEGETLAEARREKASGKQE